MHGDERSHHGARPDVRLAQDVKPPGRAFRQWLLLPFFVVPRYDPEHPIMDDVQNFEWQPSRFDEISHPLIPGLTHVRGIAIPARRFNDFHMVYLSGGEPAPPAS